MSDEGGENCFEIFPILGKSPTTDWLNNFKARNYAKNNDLNHLSSLNKSGLTNPSSISNAQSQNANLSDTSNSKSTNSDSLQSMNHSHQQHYDSEFSVISNNSSNNSVGDGAKITSFSRMNLESKTTSNALIESGCNNLSLDRTNKMLAKKGSLAASFLMGDVQLEDLKAKMHSQFPRVSNSSIKSDEMMKMQDFLNLETFKTNNFAMQKHFTALQKWQDEVKAQKDEQNKQNAVFQETIAKLRNENLELKKELENKKEQIQLNENVIQKGSKLMTQVLSEHTAQIQNLTSQIEKFEQQHLDSFELKRQIKTLKDEVQAKTKEIENEYVPILKHKTIVSDLERRLSRLSDTEAENRKLHQMQDKHKSKIKFLNEKLYACRGELKNAQSDIAILKSNEEERKRQFKLEQIFKSLQEMNQKLQKSVAVVDANASSQKSTPPLSRKNEQVYEPSGYCKKCRYCNKTFTRPNDFKIHIRLPNCYS